MEKEHGFLLMMFGATVAGKVLNNPSTCRR